MGREGKGRKGESRWMMHGWVDGNMNTRKRRAGKGGKGGREGRRDMLDAEGLGLDL